METSGPISFDRFTLDRGAHLLRERSRTIHLTPRLYALLEFLAMHPDELLSKERLLNEVWKQTHVSEGSLSRGIASLRKVLEDDAREPRIIETVPWKGYRFIAEVSSPGDELGKSRGILRIEGMNFLLKEGANLVGRGRECHVIIRSRSVSRVHARVVVEQGGVTIEDLGSLNGTQVNGTAVEGVRKIDDTSEIRFGGEEATLILTATDEPTEDLTGPGKLR